MFNDFRKKTTFLLSGLTFAAVNAFAANPVDLAHQNVAFLLPSLTAGVNAAQPMFQEIKRSSDMNQTLHVRVQQMYAGVPVWGGDAVIHIPHAQAVAKTIPAVITAANAQKGSMNGTVYQNIPADLQTPAPSAAAAQQALQAAISNYQSSTGEKAQAQETSCQLIVYIDKNNKAHWAYHVSFAMPENPSTGLPSKPNMIVDAANFAVYEQWDNLQTDDESVTAGGFGGNPKSGKYIYDGSAGNLPAFNITRSATWGTGKCTIKNKDVAVYAMIMRVGGWVLKKDETFGCAMQDPQHANLYWNGDQDSVNGGYSPENDAMYAGVVIKQLYQDWYGIPVLTNEDGTPMQLTMIVHAKMENAYWDGKEMVFGDGGSTFYPLTSIGVGAHEISHGFTQQHSNLEYADQSGALNESFSDMAAQAGELYGFGHNSWAIGAELFKGDGAIRYMDKPSKNCQAGSKPGEGCSIDNMDQYKTLIDYAYANSSRVNPESYIVHNASGIFNRVFYLMATSDGWDLRKAFNVMVQANRHYWTSTSSFANAACGVLSAAKDLGYDQTAIKNAFGVVKVDIKSC